MLGYEQLYYTMVVKQCYYGPTISQGHVILWKDFKENAS